MYDTLLTADLTRVHRRLVEFWRAGRGSGELSREELYIAAAGIKKLSRGLTGRRMLVGDHYLEDPELLSAYLMHFFPISFAQTHLALQESCSHIERGAALDLGCGPGPGTVALLEAGFAPVTACDRSPEALRALHRLNAGRPVLTRRWEAPEVPPGPFRLILLSHLLNELPDAEDRCLQSRGSLLEGLAGELAPGGRILVIEPALGETARKAIRLRDLLLEQGFSVEAPCLWPRACPALPSGTCHAEYAWKPPRDLVRLAHAARIGRHSLKFCWFLFSPPGAARTAAGEAYRVVSERLLSKSGRSRLLVCGPGGRFSLSAPARSQGAAWRVFHSLKRWDLIEFHSFEQRPNGWGLTGASRIKVLGSSGLSKRPRSW